MATQLTHYAYDKRPWWGQGVEAFDHGKYEEQISLERSIKTSSCRVATRELSDRQLEVQQQQQQQQQGIFSFSHHGRLCKTF